MIYVDEIIKRAELSRTASFKMFMRVVEALISIKADLAFSNDLAFDCDLKMDEIFRNLAYATEI